MEFTESEKVLILSLLQEPVYTAKSEAMIAKSIAVKLWPKTEVRVYLFQDGTEKYVLTTPWNKKLGQYRDFGFNPQEVN